MAAQGKSRLAILGSTGGTGRQLLAQALGVGMEVVALARQPDKLIDFRGAVTVVQGSVTDAETVQRVVAGSSAVLSALGQVQGSPADLLTTSSINIVEAMKRQSVKRLVVLTNTAVEDPSDRPPTAQRLLRAVLIIGNDKLTRDSKDAARVISDSGLDWTVVRAPILTDGPRTGNYKVGPLVGGMPLRVSRADVADFMLSCVAEGKFVRERPVISGLGKKAAAKA
jgi:putative NADH-flavin reductase